MLASSLTTYACFDVQHEVDRVTWARHMSAAVSIGLCRWLSLLSTLLHLGRCDLTDDRWHDLF